MILDTRVFNPILSLVTADTLANTAKAHGVTITDGADTDTSIKALWSGIRPGNNETTSQFVVEITGGMIDGDTLTQVLKDLLPTRKIGGAHGPYYLSKCRTGHIRTWCGVQTGGRKSTAPRPTQTAAPINTVNDLTKAFNSMSPADQALFLDAVGATKRKTTTR